MLHYEWKKIFERKLNLVAMLVGYVILALTAVLPILKESEYISKSDYEYKGMEAIHYNQDMAAKQTDYLTEEYVTKQLKELQKSGLDLSSDEGFCEASDKYGKLFMYYVNSYKDIAETEFHPEVLTELNLKNGARFYERRLELIEDYLNMDFSYGNYTNAEKDYWMKEAEKVKIPFRWGDTFVMLHYDSVIGLSFYLLLVIIICIAPIFAAESESGACQLLLTTKYGKSKMITKKVTAAYLFSFGYVALGLLACFIGLLSVLGWKGAELPVQLLNSTIPFSMNLGQFLLLQALIALVTIFFVVAATLFVSALTKSTLATMATMLFLIVGPAFLPFSIENGVYNHIISLAIVRMMDLKKCLGSFIDYTFGGFVVDLTHVGIVVHLICGAILLCFVRNIFLKRVVHF